MHHVGNVWLNELSPADSTFNYSISVATMERGARLEWHKHPGGQILLITEGTGYYQERGKPKKTVRKGEVVKCQPGVEHWHGATPTTGVTYLATSPALNGKTIWLQNGLRTRSIPKRTRRLNPLVEPLKVKPRLSSAFIPKNMGS